MIVRVRVVLKITLCFFGPFVIFTYLYTTPQALALNLIVLKYIKYMYVCTEVSTSSVEVIFRQTTVYEQQFFFRATLTRTITQYDTPRFKTVTMLNINLNKNNAFFPIVLKITYKKLFRHYLFWFKYIAPKYLNL